MELSKAMTSGTSRYFFWFGLLALLLACQCNGHKSKQLVKYDNFTKEFLLDPDALSEFASLKAPIKIIAAIGDARVGKSTALNFIQHVWKGKSRPNNFEKVFITSNKMEPCTRGVWISVVPNTDRESVVLLDVEGSNLGHDAKTDQFSIFATLLSSSLMLFGEETVTNHNRDFLFRVTRLSEEIWRDQMRDAVVNHFPALHVVLRQPLDIPKGTTIGQCIRNSIYGVNDEKNQLLRKYFSNNKLNASTIPYKKELKQGELELEALNDKRYKEDVMSLVKDVRSMDSKGTINGAQMNGEMVQELAKNLVEALNKNSWVLFSDTYTLMEKNLCDKAFEKMIKPLQNSDYRLILAKRRDVMKEFSMQCVLEAETGRAERWINDVIDGKQKAEEKQKQMEEERKKKEEEKRKQQEIEAQREREEKQQRERMEQERKNREEAERRRNEEQENARRAERARQQAQRQLEEIERAKQQAKKKKKNDIVKVLGVIAGVAAIFSDEQLKDNITTIPGSEYETIGLRGVMWTWNKKAYDLGMRGIDQGVIAQEVEKMYPWAVTVGSDGYKRVYYSFLKTLLTEKKKQERAS